MNDFVDEDFYNKRSVSDSEVLQCIPPKLLKKLGKADRTEFDQFMDSIHSIYKNSNRIGRMYAWMQNGKCETVNNMEANTEELCDQMAGCHFDNATSQCQTNLDKMAAEYRQQQAEIDAINDRIRGTDFDTTDKDALTASLDRSSSMMSFGGKKKGGANAAELAAMAMKRNTLAGTVDHEKVATEWSRHAALHQLDAQCRAAGGEGMDAKDCAAVKGHGDKSFCEPIDSEGAPIAGMTSWPRTGAASRAARATCTTSRRSREASSRCGMRPCGSRPMRPRTCPRCIPPPT